MKVYIIQQIVFGGGSHITAIVSVKSTEEKAIETVEKLKKEDLKSCYSWKAYEVDE